MHPPAQPTALGWHHVAPGSIPPPAGNVNFIAISRYLRRQIRYLYLGLAEVLLCRRHQRPLVLVPACFLRLELFR